MRLTCKLVLVLAILVLTATSASAQFPFGIGGMSGSAMLLANKSVQEELKMTKEQTEKMGNFQEKLMAKGQDLFGKLQGAKPEEMREMITKLMKEINDDAEKTAKDVLKPEQMKRLKQIELQQAGLSNFTKEDIQKNLKLTADQKDKIKIVTDDATKDTQALLKDAGRDRQKLAEARKKVQALNKEANEKVQKFLTADQKKAMDDVLGAPFELKIEPFNFKPPERQ